MRRSCIRRASAWVVFGLLACGCSGPPAGEGPRLATPPSGPAATQRRFQTPVTHGPAGKSAGKPIPQGID
jgi:hypothetical protein